MKNIPFWSRVTKPTTEYCVEENCDDHQIGTVCSKVVFVKVLSGFPLLLKNGMTRNQPKPPETTQNQPKPALPTRNRPKRDLPSLKQAETSQRISRISP